MKQLNNFILEKLKINSKSKINQYNYFPKDKKELIEIIKKKYQEIQKPNIYGNLTPPKDILDLNDIDISKITDLSYLFEYIKPIKVDMNNWDVSHVTDIHGLFWTNNIVEEIHIENWDVRNIESVYGAFYFCTNIKELNLDNWEFKKCTEFNLMFKGCEKLDTHFTDNWTMPTTHHITTNEMFEGCKYKPQWYHE